MISTLQSEENRKRFLQSISVLSNCLSERQGAEHAFNSETSSLHNLFSLGVEVISKLPAPEIARDHLPRITNSETDYTKPNAVTDSTKDENIAVNKPTPIVSTSSDVNSKASGIITCCPSTHASGICSSTSTSHEKIDYSTFQAKHDQFHNTFIASAQAAKSLNHKTEAASYLKQSLAICHVDMTNEHVVDIISSKKNLSASLCDFIGITKVTIIPRTYHRIAYVMDNLHKNYHGTYILDANALSSKVFADIFDHVPIEIINYEVNGYNSPSTGIVIATENSNSTVASLSKELESLFPLLCPFMDMSTSKDRKTASFSAGFSTSDAHQYKNNRINQVGSYRSFLMEKDLLKLSLAVRRRIAILICNMVKIFGIRDRYVESPEEKRAGSTRIKMRSQFWKLLGMTMDEVDAPLFQFFLCEGFSLISEFMLHFHQDSKNDPSDSYGGTYSIKAPILLTKELIENNKIIRLLAKQYGLVPGDILPVSFMGYSRKGNGDNIRRDIKAHRCLMGEIKEDCGLLLRAVMGGINDIERCERNYSAKWDNPSKHLKELIVDKKETDGFTEDKKYGKKSTNDLRSFRSVRTQYDGFYAKHLPSYDKMSYWSAILDLLFDIAANVKKDLSSLDVMGFILFCAIECNGTVLPVGIISARMKDEYSRKVFGERIVKHGMYYTLLKDAISLAADRRTNVVACSTGNRHLSHNRTYFNKKEKSKAMPNPAGIPVFNLPPAYNDESQNGLDHRWTFKDKEHRKKSFKEMKQHCRKLEISFVKLCSESWKPLPKKKRKVNKKKNDEKSCISDDSSPLAEEMTSFLEKIQEIAGLGCGHIFSLNFVQLAACLGFLPTHLMQYSSVADKASGGYKLIVELYKNSGIMITPKKAQELFESTVKHLRTIFSHNVSYPYVENMLCELWREYGGKTVSQKDYFFFLPHRENCLEGLQNLFRFNYESASSMTLEMLPVTLENSSLCAASKINLMQWEKKKIIGSSGVITWENRSKGHIVSTESTLSLDTSFAEGCYKCKNNKRDNPVDEDAISAGPVTSKRKKK